MAKIVALTTNDNPYSPFDEFEKWFMFDNDHGYNSCSYLARVARTSDALTPQENSTALEEAIDDIVRLDFTERYKKVSKEVPDSESDDYYMMEEATN